MRLNVIIVIALFVLRGLDINVRVLFDYIVDNIDLSRVLFDLASSQEASALAARWSLPSLDLVILGPLQPLHNLLINNIVILFAVSIHINAIVINTIFYVVDILIFVIVVLRGILAYLLLEAASWSHTDGWWVLPLLLGRALIFEVVSSQQELLFFLSLFQ